MQCFWVRFDRIFDDAQPQNMGELCTFDRILKMMPTASHSEMKTDVELTVDG
jgi:hypothetical protein